MKLDIGSTIRKGRKTYGMTQEQLAEKLGVSTQSVNRWETGANYPDIELLPHLASILRISIDTFFLQDSNSISAHCDELFQKLEESICVRNDMSIVWILKQIKNNLWQCQDYDFWDLYSLIWFNNLYKNPDIMIELRSLTNEIFRYCPKSDRDVVVEWMAVLEDDNHIDSFIENNASITDLSKNGLFVKRYRFRQNYEKQEKLRQFHLWELINEIIDVPADWGTIIFEDPQYMVQCNNNNLTWLHRFRNIDLKEEYPLTGNNAIDIWCDPLFNIGLRQIDALSIIGYYEEAFKMFEDFVSLLEKIMAIETESFVMTCSSQALQNFSMEANFIWTASSDGRQHKQLRYESNGVACCIQPKHYLKYAENHFSILSSDLRYEKCIRRLEGCIITR